MALKMKKVSSTNGQAGNADKKTKKLPKISLPKKNGGKKGQSNKNNKPKKVTDKKGTEDKKKIDLFGKAARKEIEEMEAKHAAEKSDMQRQISALQAQLYKANDKVNHAKRILQ